MTDSINILYAAHTASCTFLLDAEGFCRRVVVDTSNTKRRDAARAASRCVGAQYVASLDASVTGLLAELPRVGASMLFARVDERGRVSLVRTGAVTRFESNREDPFREPGASEKDSVSVQTSAPAIAPSAPAPRLVRSNGHDEEVEVEVESVDPTHRIPVARASELRARSFDERDDDVLDTTAEYQAQGVTPQPWSSSSADLEPHPATLRQATLMPPPPSSDDAEDLMTTLRARSRADLLPVLPPPATRNVLTPPPPRPRSDSPPRPADHGRAIPRIRLLDKVAGRTR